MAYRYRAHFRSIPIREPLMFLFVCLVFCSFAVVVGLFSFLLVFRESNYTPYYHCLKIR